MAKSSEGQFQNFFFIITPLSFLELVSTSTLFFEVLGPMTKYIFFFLRFHNIYFKKISDTKNTYMIYENDQLTKLIKNTKTIHIYNIWNDQ